MPMKFGIKTVVTNGRLYAAKGISRNRPSLMVAKSFIVLLFLFGALRANAEEAGTSFADQCPVLYAQADSFANACLANAQPFKRYFNDEPEYHSAYLGKAAPESHFALGCALNAKHEIAYLGVYYSLDGNDFNNANTAPVAGVDFTGNIAVILNNRLVNFMAVRPFQTKTIPLPYYAQSPINCEPFNLPSNETEDNAGQKYFVTERHVGSKIWIRSCSSTPTTCLPDAEYYEIVKGMPSDGFLAPTVGYYLRDFIEPGGGFLVSKPELQKDCPYVYALQKKKRQYGVAR